MREPGRACVVGPCQQAAWRMAPDILLTDSLADHENCPELEDFIIQTPSDFSDALFRLPRFCTAAEKFYYSDVIRPFGRLGPIFFLDSLL